MQNLIFEKLLFVVSQWDYSYDLKCDTPLYLANGVTGWRLIYSYKYYFIIFKVVLFIFVFLEKSSCATEINLLEETFRISLLECRKVKLIVCGKENE